MKRFSQTEKALDEYDSQVKLLSEVAADITNAESVAICDEIDRLAKEVGKAFGLDTSDFNSVDTCRNCVRPGPWLRRLVQRGKCQTTSASANS